MQQFVSVVSFPDLPEGGKPRIEGKVKAEYEVGDELNFTCSAGKAFPPVKISWYLNDVPVNCFSFTPLPSLRKFSFRRREFSSYSSTATATASIRLGPPT